ncbi:MAG: restriction endonuclease subunit S [Cyclobacteriaceae bacterium]
MQVKLSQILSTLESGGRPKGGASLDNKGIPSLGAEHLDGNGGFNFKTVKYIPEEYFNGLKNGIIEKEDILIVKDGATTGKVSFVTDDFPFDRAAVNEHVFLLKVDKSKANPKFTFHYLKCPQGQRDIMRDFRGATVGGISRGFVDFVKFALPSLPDQLHIATILSKAENLIAQRKESIRLLDEFLKSTFSEMFGDPMRNEKGWETKQLGSVTQMKAGQFVAASDIQPEYSEGLYSCYGGNGLRGYVKTYTHEGAFVLIGRQGALCGNVKIAKGQFHATEHAVVCSPKMEFETYWLYYLLDVINLNKYASGAAQPGLAVGRLEQIEIIFPPPLLQTQFAHIVEKAEALKNQYQQSLTELENLYGSLSQKAFKGELSLKTNHVNP